MAVRGSDFWALITLCDSVSYPACQQHPLGIAQTSLFGLLLLLF